MASASRSAIAEWDQVQVANATQDAGTKPRAPPGERVNRKISTESESPDFPIRELHTRLWSYRPFSEVIGCRVRPPRGDPTISCSSAPPPHLPFGRQRINDTCEPAVLK